MNPLPFSDQMWISFMRTLSSPKRGLAALAIGAIAAPLLAAAVATPSHAVTASDFTIDSVATGDARAVDTNPAISDDGGFTAITPSHILQTGDRGLAAYDRDLTAPLADCEPVTAPTGASSCPGLVAQLSALLVSDVETRSAYLFSVTYSEVTASATFTGIWPINDDGTLTDSATTTITLSEAIEIGNDCGVTASGWGRVVIWDVCLGDLYSIDLPSGAVTVDSEVWAGADFATTIRNSEAQFPINIFAQGVAEDIGGRTWIALLTNDDTTNLLTRFGLQEDTAALETIHTFASPFDAAGFAVAPADDLWCFHMEGGAVDFPVADSMSEPLVCASATFTTPVAAVEPEPEAPQLAETGPAASLSIAAIALLLCGAGAAIMMIRRPQTQSASGM